MHRVLIRPCEHLGRLVPDRIGHGAEVARARVGGGEGAEGGGGGAGRPAEVLEALDELHLAALVLPVGDVLLGRLLVEQVGLHEQVVVVEVVLEHRQHRRRQVPERARRPEVWHGLGAPLPRLPRGRLGILDRAGHLLDDDIHEARVRLSGRVAQGNGDGGLVETRHARAAHFIDRLYPGNLEQREGLPPELGERESPTVVGALHARPEEEHAQQAEVHGADLPHAAAGSLLEGANDFVADLQQIHEGVEGEHALHQHLHSGVVSHAAVGEQGDKVEVVLQPAQLEGGVRSVARGLPRGRLLAEEPLELQVRLGAQK
mmetsp:Transcript_45620/g.145281  ORF Transcript_45620/g.145281 Transcript_45620/m.145281 type:complete len:317 (-) Transcript_45620:499-1449(-)